MKTKKYLLLFIFMILIFDSILFLLIENHRNIKLNMIEVNDISETVKENWNNLSQETLSELNYDLDYVVIDEFNKIVYKTKDGLNEDINSAITNRDAVIELKNNDKYLGKLIIYNDANEVYQNYKSQLLSLSIIFISFFGVISFCYVFYINKTIIKPFNKLKNFAKHVAQGNLDIPLSMDRGNYFGSFTESFDLMREELKTARENERKANQSKKELVATLSHDIKTPVASIKAVSEIMQVKTNDEIIKKQLEIIDAKADQINTLITNMFNATLEELQELKVSLKETSSTIIYNLIKEVDYKNKVELVVENECIVLIDSLRLSQVIDNIISNSYKYADSKIKVNIKVYNQYLEVGFKDYGPGISNVDLPLVFNKFYRGENSKGKSGTGLGLYISKYLMNKMQGDIICENVEDGFIVTLKLLIA